MASSNAFKAKYVGPEASSPSQPTAICSVSATQGVVIGDVFPAAAQGVEALWHGIAELKYPV